MPVKKAKLRPVHARVPLQVLFLATAVLGIFGIGMTGLIYPYFFCPASPGACAGCPIWVIEHGVLEVLSGSASGWSMLLYLVSMFVIIGLVMGRSFCGLACPVGTLQDLFSWIRTRAKSTRAVLGVGGASLLLLADGSLGAYAAAWAGSEPRSYMWMGYAASAGAFLLALTGLLLVERRKGFIIPAALLVLAGGLFAVPRLSGPAGMGDTPLGSKELWGLFAMMSATIGLVGLAIRLMGKLPSGVRPGGRADRRLRWIKYGVLLAIAPTTMLFNTLAFTDIDPIGGITATVPELFLDPAGWSANKFFWVKAAFPVGVIAMVAFVDRGWCRYLCPVGALYAPTNRIALTDVRFDEAKCIHCQKCIAVCPMRINPKQAKTDPECIRCGRCADVCPVDAQKFIRPSFGRGGART